MVRQVFTSSGTYTPPAGVTSVGVLVVGGAGGGGCAGSRGGGGGAGQVRWEAAVAVTPGTPVTVTVGAGGAQRTTTGAGNSGTQSAFGAITAAGGGGGGGGNGNGPTSGASGGGGAGHNGGNAHLGAAGTAGGNGGDGHVTEVGGDRVGGGGGGAGGNGGSAPSAAAAGAGGVGVDMSANVGTDVGVAGWFGAGGGGGAWAPQTPGTGGTGGGGAGSATDAAPTTGTPNTGSGGGGSSASDTPVGAAGGSGVVIVVWDEEPAPPTYETITGSSTSSLTSPTTRWVKGTMRPVWSDGSTWSAIVPTLTGHRRYADLEAPSPGAVVESRQAARVTAVHAGGTTYVLRAHTSSSLFSAFDGSWSAIVDGAAFPLTAADLDASPVTLHRSPNGHLWAAVLESGALKVTRSTDGGTTWATPVNLVASLTDTGVVGFGQSWSTVVLIATGNGGIGRWVRAIDQDAGSIASGSWSTETLPGLPSGVTSDDHLAVTSTPDGRVLAVSKTTDATTSAHPVLYLLARTTGGTWSSHTIEPGPDTGVRYTRPVLTIVGGDAVVMYGSIQDPMDLTTRTAPLADLSSWSSRAALFAGPDWSDSAVLPPADAVRRHGDTFPVLAHKRDAAAVVVGWQDAPPPVRDGASTATTTVSTTGLGHKATGAASTTAALVSTTGSGRKTSRGAGVASVSTTATGTGAKRTTGSSTASTDVAPSGAGLRRVGGASTTDVTAAATGAGTKRGAGSSTAPASVATVGSGRRVESGTGASTTPVTVTATGAGAKRAAGSSTTGAGVATVGQGHRVQSGQGASVVTIGVTPSGVGVKVARGGSVATIATTAYGAGARVHDRTGASTAPVGVQAVGVGYARHLGASIATVRTTAHGTGHNPDGPDDVELTLARGPYANPMTAGRPRTLALTITGPRE